jgi:hypothetical protein
MLFKAVKIQPYVVERTVPFYLLDCSFKECTLFLHTVYVFPYITMLHKGDGSMCGLLVDYIRG